MSDLVTPILGLTKPTVGADLDVWGGITNANWDIVDKSPGLHNVGRNYIHNPLFNIQQRGVGPWVLATGAPAFTADRWVAGFVGGTMTVSLIALADADRTAIGDEAATNAIRAVFTGGGAAAAQTYLYHGIESVRRLSGKTVTLSFYAKAASGTPKLGFSLDQNFGIGGSPSPTAVGTGQSVTLSTAWARYALTFTIPSATGKVLGTSGTDCIYLNVFFSAGASSAAMSGTVGVQSGTVTLWGLQLELGSPATPLEKPDPQQDLAKCQRFYQDSSSTSSVGFSTSGYTAAAGAIYGNISFPVRMRAVPTITPLNMVLNNVAGPTYQGCIDGLFVAGSGTAAGQFSWSGGFTASADI
jgi:hypothetical protein